MSFWRICLTLPLLLPTAWVIGFIWFLGQINASPPPPGQADGIIALTGGADRMEHAFRLLAEGYAPLLLISGVAGEATLGVLVKRVGGDAESFANRVTLGRRARSTRGNARESAAWAQSHQMRSVIVVTANYHMPRALVEMRRTMPGIVLRPAPVVPPALREGASVPLLLLASEYTKLIGASLGMSAWFGREAMV